MPERPKICAVIVSEDFTVPPDVLPLVDLFEVRIDLIGAAWKEAIKKLNHPWLATNRTPVEGGRGEADEEERVSRLLEAIELGASMVDIELSTRRLKKIVPKIGPKAACLISFHDFAGTPSLRRLTEIVERQIKAGADICKVVTTATGFEDNLTMLRLIKAFPQTKMVALTMGPLGMISRILSPLAGAYFTYASLEKGKESAPGQMTVAELREIYRMIGAGNNDNG
jgi:3-dehydroquinate dehydratase type I